MKNKTSDFGCEYCIPTYKTEVRYESVLLVYPKGRKKGQPRTEHRRREFKTPVFENMGISHFIYIDGDTLDISSNSHCAHGDEIKIKYCPMCARDLRKEVCYE